MMFKKHGSDPGFAMPSTSATLPGLPGGPPWIVNLGRAVQEFVQSVIEPDRPATFYDGFRYVRSGRSNARRDRKRRRNMLHVSRRVRHKHRLARKAA